MIVALFAVLLAVQSPAQTPADSVSKVLRRVDGVVAGEAGKDAGEIAQMDRRIRSMEAELKSLGGSAAQPLGDAVRSDRYAPKTRLFATAFLIRVAGGAAVDELARILLDDSLDSDIRQAAAQGLVSIDAPAEKPGLAFCTALAKKELPRPVLDDVLVGAERLGCADSFPLEGRARAYGPRPTGLDLTTTRRALVVLQKSPGPIPLKSLLKLIAYFPVHGDARAAALAALTARRAEVAARLGPEALPLLRTTLREENARKDSMLSLIRLIDAFGPEVNDALLPLAKNGDAEVIAEAAEALARRGAVKALPVLDEVVLGALHDPRFAPLKDGPDPARLLARIEAAVAILRRGASPLRPLAGP